LVYKIISKEQSPGKKIINGGVQPAAIWN